MWLLWRKERGAQRWICLKEDYYSGRDERHQLTDGELVDRLDKMLDGVKIERVIIGSFVFRGAFGSWNITVENKIIV